MSFLIDTNVAIELRDRTRETMRNIAQLGARPAISILSWVELEGGTYKNPMLLAERRASLDVLLSRLSIVNLDEEIVHTYRSILTALGFSRRRIIDRMIAATAIVHGMTLITVNGADFRDIPDLKLEIWPAPAAQ